MHLIMNNAPGTNIKLFSESKNGNEFKKIGRGCSGSKAAGF